MVRRQDHSAFVRLETLIIVWMSAFSTLDISPIVASADPTDDYVNSICFSRDGSLMAGGHKGTTRVSLPHGIVDVTPD